MHQHNYETKNQNPATNIQFPTIGLTFNAQGQLSQLSLQPVKVTSPAAAQPACATALKLATQWLDAYFAGKFEETEKLTLQLLNSSTLQLAGTPYQQKVWQTICAVPAGYTASYKDIALKLQSGPRAVGGANGKNPIPLIIPCHRIVAANGTLGGYSGPGGLQTKAKLLAHEGANSL